MRIPLSWLAEYVPLGIETSKALFQELRAL